MSALLASSENNHEIPDQKQSRVLRLGEPSIFFYLLYYNSQQSVLLWRCDAVAGIAS